MHGTYNLFLVFASYVVACIAAYAAVEFTTRVKSDPENKRMWITAGALIMGIGIWSMHFIGMLAYEMNMPVAYDVPLTTISIVFAFIAAAIALYIASQATFTIPKLIIAGTVMGLGIASMHYVGMEAMLMNVRIQYDKTIFSLSIAIAIVGATGALWLIHYLINLTPSNFQIKLEVISSLIMAIAITGMHYTGMYAANYLPIALDNYKDFQGINTQLLAATIFSIALPVIITAILSANISHSINDKKRIVILLLVMLTAVLIAVSITINLLYQTAYQESKQQLRTLTSTHANLSVAIARFDAEHSQKTHPEGARGATISQIIHGFQAMDKSFVQSEIILALRKFDDINIYVSDKHLEHHNQKHTNINHIDPTVFALAFSGKSGVYQTWHIDHHSEQKHEALIAYDYIKELDAAILAALPLSDIQAPFIQASYISAVIALLLVILGSWLFLKISNPLIEKLENSRQELEKEIEERTQEIVKIHQFHEKIMDSSTLAIFVLNNQLEFTLVNPAICKLTGFEYDELMSLGFANLFYPKRFRSIKKIISDINNNKTPISQHETQIFTNHGNRNVIISLSPMFENSEIISYVGTIEDITQRKEAERQIVLAKEQAEQASITKSEFLANMSHEIRTPMNGIIGMLALLKDSRLTKEQKDFLNTAESSSEILLSLLNDILDFSKIEAGHLILEKTDFKFYSTVEDSAVLFAEQAINKNVEILCDIDPEIPEILNGDPTRLSQVLNNLIGNAIKFTNDGEIIVRSKLTSANDSSYSIHFEISDTGVGIPEESLENIFESFKQADGSTTRNYGGTGLGLAISKQLVNLMGGEIGVTSKQGEGSTFWFTTKLEKPRFVSNIKFRKSIDNKFPRILIVDDNATNRKILERQLEAWNISYHTAENGPQMLDIIDKDNNFDIILLDMMMPGMNGLEVAEKIHNKASDKKPKIILLTSVMQDKSNEELQQLGIQLSLRKPVRQSLLFDNIINLSDKYDSSITDTEIVKKKARKLKSMKNKGNILIAEDNPVNQKVVAEILKRLGYRADIVKNGREAVDAIINHNYDMVFMDCQMPELDGYQATQKIRQLSDGKKDVTIIALTANAMKGDKEKCTAAGMNDYLAKPIRPENMSDMLDKWIN